MMIATSRSACLIILHAEIGKCFQQLPGGFGFTPTSFERKSPAVVVRHQGCTVEEIECVPRCFWVVFMTNRRAKAKRLRRLVGNWHAKDFK